MTDKKRVAIYKENLLPASETFILSQARALSTWQPILIGRNRSKDGLDLAGQPTELVPQHGGETGRLFRQMLWLPERNLVQRLKSLDIRLVHAHFGTDATDIWPSVKAAGLPMLVTLHGYDINIHKWWWQAGHGGLKRRSYPDRLLHMAQDPSTRFIAVSKAIKRRAIEQGIPEDKINVCYIGVDTDWFKPGGLPLDQRKKRILYIGRMVEKKAPLLMIHAFSEVRKKIPNAELVMIGSGPLLNPARDLAKALNVSVEFLGSRTPDEVLTQFHQARAFCLPSVTAANGDAEGFGIVLLEAQACGLPVVTSALGGAQEGVVHGRTGITFNEGSLPELTAGLLHVLDDNVATPNAAMEAARFVKLGYDIHSCTRRLENSYNASTNAGSSP